MFGIQNLSFHEKQEKIMRQLPLRHPVERAPSTNWPSSFLKSESVTHKSEPGKVMFKLSLGN